MKVFYVTGAKYDTMNFNDFFSVLTMKLKQMCKYV